MMDKFKSVIKKHNISNYLFNIIKDIYYSLYEKYNQGNIMHVIYELNDIHINNIFNTLSVLLNSNKSIGRFGDGDLSNMLTNGALNDAEKHSDSLSKALIHILNNNNNNFMVGLPDSFISLNNYNVNSKRYWVKFINNYGKRILPYLNRNKIYYDTSITRPYMDFYNKKNSGLIFYLMKKLWSDKKVLVIEGQRSRVGVKDDLLSDVVDVKRIECPVTNAFESYDKILNTALKFLNQHKGYISLLSLGSTATVLSFDLCNKGFRAIDIGNIDLEYEWYLKGVQNKTDLPYKYVLEVPNGNKALPISLNNKYFKEIISSIH